MLERIIILCSISFSAALLWPSNGLGQSEAAMVVDKATTGTLRQQQWLAATPSERSRLAEAIGDEGARAMAKAKGYDLIYDGTSRTLPQGPDQVYGGKNGRIIVYEAKGGSGQLGHAYGHPQGSSEWAVESAKRVLRSLKASEAEKQAAERILEAAAKGNIEVHVVRTSHVLGEPSAAVLEQSMRCSDDATRLAQAALDDIAKASSAGFGKTLSATDDAIRPVVETGTFAKTLSKVVLPLAVVADAGLRVSEGFDTEQRFTAGEITLQQREAEHVGNVAGMAGGWAGAWVGAKLGAAGGAATGTAVAPGPGTAIGGVAGVVAGGAAGYFGGEAAAQAAASWAVSSIHATGTTIKESAKATWNVASNAANSTANGLARAWNWVWAK